MTKKGLIQAVHATLGKGALCNTERTVNAILAVIEQELINGNTIFIPFFGRLGVRERKEHKGINPQTKEEIIIPKQRRPYFKAGTTLMRKINR